jgi:nitrogen fixation protein NifU and related proteins
MPTFNPLMMRQIIMDHYEHPRNKRTVDDSRYVKIHMDSVSCVDDIYIYLLIEKDVIIDAAFDGIGCIISIASTSIMTELLINKTKNEALYIIDQYTSMIYEKEYDESVLNEAIVFINTSKQASRIKCATLGWTGAYKLLKGEEDE